jgi:hypothetical protein
MLLVTAVSCCLFAFTAFGQASVTVKKDGSGNYTTITAALGSVAQEIVVHAGEYVENLTISRPVTLRAYEGPLLTTINGAADSGKPVVRVAGSIQQVHVSGFRIANGLQGVVLDAASIATVSNSIVENNTNEGIRVNQGGNNTSLSAYNNVIANNGAAGIFLVYSSFNVPFANIQGNIIMENRNYGVQADSTSGKERIYIANNNLYLNIPSNYSSQFGGSGIVLGAGMLYDVDPRFVGAGTNDVRLRVSSPASQCINAGPVTASFNDPDGSRNDLGAFGGPYAATFFESPLDGPMVRQVTVNPSPVIQGETFTIRAIGAVR